MDDCRGALGGRRAEECSQRTERALPKEPVVTVDGRVDAAGVDCTRLHGCKTRSRLLYVMQPEATQQH